MRLWPKRETEEEWKKRWCAEQYKALIRALSEAEKAGDTGHVDILRERLKTLRRQMREDEAGVKNS